MRLARETSVQGDFSDGGVGVSESLASGVDAKVPNKLSHAASIPPSKLAGQVNWMHSSAQPTVIGCARTFIRSCSVPWLARLGGGE